MTSNPNAFPGIAGSNGYGSCFKHGGEYINTEPGMTLLDYFAATIPQESIASLLSKDYQVLRDFIGIDVPKDDLALVIKAHVKTRFMMATEMLNQRSQFLRALKDETSS